MKKIILSLFTIVLLLQAQSLYTRAKKSFGSSKCYTKSAPYAGYGKKSTSTGKIKVKSTSGYFKPSAGYKFVNPYARS